MITDFELSTQVLAIFDDIGINHVLYTIVFGESLLNGKRGEANPSY